MVLLELEMESAQSLTVMSPCPHSWGPSALQTAGAFDMGFPDCPSTHTHCRSFGLMVDGPCGWPAQLSELASPQGNEFLLGQVTPIHS